MKCPACGADSFAASSQTCSRCGYAEGEANRCPHCGATARTEGAGKTTVCAMCGGPRIPGGFGGEDARLALKEQKTHLGNARLSSLATIVQGIFATIATLIALMVMPASIAGKVIMFLIAAAPLFLAMRSRGKATAARQKAADANERAWQAAAEDLAARSKDGVTAAGLAKSLGLETEQADKLLTELAVHDRTRIDVGDDAEVRYSSVHPGPRVATEEEEKETAAALDELEEEAAATSEKARVK